MVGRFGRWVLGWLRQVGWFGRLVVGWFGRLVLGWLVVGKLVVGRLV